MRRAAVDRCAEKTQILVCNKKGKDSAFPIGRENSAKERERLGKLFAMLLLPGQHASWDGRSAGLSRRRSFAPPRPNGKHEQSNWWKNLVGAAGIEPATLGLEKHAGIGGRPNLNRIRCSKQLQVRAVASQSGIIVQRFVQHVPGAIRLNGDW